MAWIGLEDMEIRNARIGYYAEEKQMGNAFRVSVMAALTIAHPEADDLTHTLNYETVHAVVQAVMAQEADLIETAAYRIHEGLVEAGAAFDQLQVTIRKYKPLQVAGGGDSVIVMTFP